MKPDQPTYDSIPVLPSPAQSFEHSPGIYCVGCGATFALYSHHRDGMFVVYSHRACAPIHIDENDKPFYHTCFRCPPTTDLP